MKIVSYDPRNIENMSIFFNDKINEYKNDDSYSGFIMFIFEEIFAEVKDEKILCESYKKLLTDYNLPYAFFPYFLHFNKVLPGSISFPNPKLKINTENGSFNIVLQPCFGMLVLNLELLNEFKFNEQYGTSFYIQDLIFYCKDNDLYFSKAFYFDVCESYKLFNSSFKEGYVPNVEAFKKEKELFFSNHKNEGENINTYVETLKEKFKPINILEDLSKQLKECEK
jgi:hypothetical protein